MVEPDAGHQRSFSSFGDRLVDSLIEVLPFSLGFHPSVAMIPVGLVTTIAAASEVIIVSEVRVIRCARDNRHTYRPAL